MEDQKIDFVKIKFWRDEINKLLAERPELIPFQQMIDRELEKAGKNHGNRMSVLMGLMCDKQTELSERCTELVASLNKFVSLTEGKTDETPIH